MLFAVFAIHLVVSSQEFFLAEGFKAVVEGDVAFYVLMLKVFSLDQVFVFCLSIVFEDNFEAIAGIHECLSIVIEVFCIFFATYLWIGI